MPHPTRLLSALTLGLVSAAVTAPALADGAFLNLFSHGAEPVEVGPVPEGIPSGRGGVDTETCAGCHVEIAAEWRDSFHRQAWTDPMFQAAFAQEPLESCQNCHAPRRAPGQAPSGLAAQDGVDCATCHVREGRVLAVGDGRGAPHAVEQVPFLSTSAYCAGCHQFDFPAERGAARGHPPTQEPMQDTYEEWALSDAAAAGTECQDCHMPEENGHRSHRFLGSHDTDFMVRAVRVEADVTRDGDEQVVSIRIAPAAIGHAFPTGDLFRRAELQVQVEGQDPEVVAFVRDFHDVPERMPSGEVAFVRRERADSRIPPPGFGAPRAHVFRFPADRGPVRWSLAHLLMPSPLAASQGFADARVRRVLHRGTLTLEPERCDASSP
ncbi:MAG: multiheme c-type cytochrome [Sandaracinaceae bacterium]